MAARRSSTCIPCQGRCPDRWDNAAADLGSGLLCGASFILSKPGPDLLPPDHMGVVALLLQVSNTGELVLSLMDTLHDLRHLPSHP